MSYDMMDFGGMMGYGGWWSVLAIAFWLLIFVALVLAIFWLVKSLSGDRTQESAEDVLKKRYAKGEIAKAEFDQKMKDIGK